MKFNKVFDVCGINFMGPFLSSNGNKYNLFVMDHVSKWVKAYVLPTNIARTIVRFLKHLFTQLGSPQIHH